MMPAKVVLVLSFPVVRLALPSLTRADVSLLASEPMVCVAPLRSSVPPLVIVTGEFGRTPYAQVQEKAKHGRDHHHTAFSYLLAGGGVKGGLAYGTSDEFGMNAQQNPVHVHDLHATLLRLLGIDHLKLTYKFQGRAYRLTDIHGNLVPKLIA